MKVKFSSQPFLCSSCSSWSDFLAPELLPYIGFLECHFFKLLLFLPLGSSDISLLPQYIKFLLLDPQLILLLNLDFHILREWLCKLAPIKLALNIILNHGCKNLLLKDTLPGGLCTSSLHQVIWEFELGLFCLWKLLIQESIQLVVPCETVNQCLIARRHKLAFLNVSNIGLFEGSMGSHI